MGVVIRAVVLTALLCVSSWAFAQQTPADVTLVVCGQQSQNGVTYVIAPGSGYVQCGLDTSGNELVLQRSSVTLAQIQSSSPGSSTPDGSGVTAGMAIGGAMFAAMAVAFGFRLLRNFLNSSSEG